MVNLAAYVKGTTKIVRLAVYDTSNNLLIDSDQCPFNDSSLAWQGKTWSSGYPTLTGGTSYRLALVVNSNNVIIAYDTGDSGDYTRGPGWVNYVTEGWPNPLADNDDGTQKVYIRCGVEAAAGGGATLTAEQVGSDIHLDWTMPGD